MLLDEATAALDPENEAAIQDALAALAAGRTVLVIAHRLQTIAAADQIIVLDHGRVVEQGTHNQLLGQGGRYTAFWRERSRTPRAGDSGPHNTAGGAPPGVTTAPRVCYYRD